MSKAVLLAALVLGATGCVSVEMGRLGRRVAADVSQQDSVEVGRGFASSFGRGTIGTGRFLGRMFAPSSTEPFRRLSGHVDAIKIARYPISGPFDARIMGRPEWLADVEADGWLSLVTVRDSSAFVTVHYRDDDDRVTDLLIVTVAEEDIVLTKLSGDLTALVADAVALGSEVDINGRGILETAFGVDEGEESDEVEKGPEGTTRQSDARP